MDRDDINYVFSIDALMPGDILVLTNNDDKLIQKAGTKYIHAAIYMGDAQIIESNGYGVTMTHIYSYGFKEPDDAYILRYPNLKPDQIFRLIRTCRENMGREWSGLQVARVQTLKDTDNRDDGNKTFCSRLVAEAYESVGIKLVKNPSYCSPEDFLNCDVLMRVANPLVKADENYKNLVERYDRIRESGDEILPLSTLYENLSKYYHIDIQSFGQVLIASIDNPTMDDGACDIIRNSDYFKNAGYNGYPWLDKNEDFFNHFPEVERQLFFIENNYLHYTLTYIPCCRDNLNCMEKLEQMYPQSKVIVLFDCVFLRVMKSNLKLLKRISQLYFLIKKRTPKEYEDFIKTYKSDFTEKLKPILDL
jgi:hypothetical protein